MELTPMFRIEHSSETLSKISKEDFDYFIKKFHSIPMEPLTVEETYRLREALMSARVHIDFIEIAVKDIKTEPKKSLWKRLNRK